MANSVSVGAAAFCLVTMLLFVQTHAQPSEAPAAAPWYAPEWAPVESPTYAPEYAPEMAPEMAPVMAPTADSPTTLGPAVMNALESSASSNVVSGAAVLVGFAAFFLY